jgi:CheY-like chemotaxis protein
MKKILLIEDDQLIANIYSNKLTTGADFKVHIARDGESGLQTIEKFQPDVIILDLMLPKMSGIDVLKTIRARADAKHIPVVVFSNTYLSNLVQEAWKAGATKCLSKSSCTPKQLISVLKGIFHPVPAGIALTESGTQIIERPSVSDAHPPTVDADSSEPVQDDDIPTDLRVSFFASAPASLAACRVDLQSAAKARDELSRAKCMADMYARVRSFTANAGMAGVASLAHMGDALEALLKELSEKPSAINPSTVRTVALAVDFLGFILDRTTVDPSLSAISATDANILVVDDEAISRRAVMHALNKAKLSATPVEHPESALEFLQKTACDIVFLDVSMPGMSGFELCTKLRALPNNKNTPVVFVTSLSDFENRANSTMRGGNDLIAKPFHFMELAVKALVYVLRGRITAHQAEPVAA